jgi:hypothetical protein
MKMSIKDINTLLKLSRNLGESVCGKRTSNNDNQNTLLRN